MVEIRAGARIPASLLNDIAPVVGRLASDFSRTSTAAVAASGLAVPVKAGTLYAIRGYLPYRGDGAADLRIALVGPSGATGHWGVTGLATTTGGATGDLNAARVSSFAAGSTLLVGSGPANTDQLMAGLHGSILVGSTAGTLAVHIGQGTSNAAATVLQQGAWLQLVKITT